MQELSKRTEFLPCQKDMKLNGWLEAPILILVLDNVVRQSKTGLPSFSDIDDIELVKGVEEIINRYKKEGFVIAGVSDEGGVGGGLKTQTEALREINRTKALFDSADTLDTVEWSIANPNVEEVVGNPHKFNSFSRMPNTGLLYNIERFCLNNRVRPDYKNSLIIGTGFVHSQFAKNANIPYIHKDMFFDYPYMHLREVIAFYKSLKI